MKNKIVFFLLLTLLAGCTATGKPRLWMAKGYYEQEYHYYLKSIHRLQEEVPRIEANTLDDFLDRFAPLYTAFYRVNFQKTSVLFL